MTKDAKGHGSNARGTAAGTPTRTQLKAAVKASAKQPTIDSLITSSQKATGPRYSVGRWEGARKDYQKAEKAAAEHRKSGNADGIKKAQAAMSDARVRMAAESTKPKK